MDSPGRGAVVEDLRGARSVLLVSHENPDADGAGSALALALGLRALGKEARVAFPSPLPSALEFLPGSREVHCPSAGRPLPPEFRPDTVVSLDCGAAERLGGLLPIARGASRFLNVDHHIGNEGFGTRAWVDARYAATGTMALEILQDLGVPPAADGSLCIYAALVTDTGNFAYSNTDPRTHLVAAACVARGVRPELLTWHLHRRRTRASWHLEGAAAAALRVSHGGAIAWISVTRDMVRSAGADQGDIHDLIRIPVSLTDTRIGLLFEEAASGSGTRVSLRSRCAVGVHTVAQRFGGGGHARAAGCFFPGALAAAETALLAEASRALGIDGGGSPPPQDA
jgi:phosphoesterase RecJ-like protein